MGASMSYREREGKPYCDHCYTDTVLPKCGGCGQPITDRALRAFDKQWHIKCFVCSECKKTFEGSQNFYSIDNQPVCGPCAGVNENEQLRTCERFQLSVVLMLQNEKNNKKSSLFLMISFDKSKWIFYITFEDTNLSGSFILLLKIQH